MGLRVVCTVGEYLDAINDCVCTMNRYRDELNFLEGLLGNLEGNTPSPRNIQELCNILLMIEQLHTTAPLSEAQTDALFDARKNTICRVSRVMRKPDIARVISASNVQGRSIRRLRDVVLDPIFRLTHNVTILQTFVNNVFTEFVKGITYFQVDTVHQPPVYHRDSSCGQRNRAGLAGLDCTGHDTGSDEWTHRSSKVRNCLVDRLVYDQIFCKYHPFCEQDLRHAHMLRDTDRAMNKFESCFPNTPLHVTLEWSADGLFPTVLNVQIGNATKRVSEIYMKTLNAYDPATCNCNAISNLNVDVSTRYAATTACTKVVYDNESRVRLFLEKTQSWHAQTPWVETAAFQLSLPPGPSIRFGGRKRKMSKKRGTK